MQLLLCHDGTSGSEAAVALGSRLATQLRAQVTVLGASDQPEREAAVARALDDVCGSLRSAGLTCEPLPRTGTPVDGIVAQATQETYDLVVIGPLEQRRLNRWLHGTLVRRVLSEVTTPVLIVPADRPVLRDILLCSGDLWYPAKTIALVAQIAQATGAHVTLLYVTPQALLHYPILHDVEDAWGALLQTDTPQGQNLKAGRDHLRGLGIETGVRLRHGPVEAQILAEIREGEYDLVALGSTYSAHGLRHHFVNSITDFVVEHAARPVLVVRNPET